mmetsp:Transcript_27572/g.110466  ORF Transcript_27572/g.110466 Transcript_27572/m.110466 type:complete len:83 (-) Transcript_27572:873-1121(-)
MLRALGSQNRRPRAVVAPPGASTPVRRDQAPLLEEPQDHNDQKTQRRATRLDAAGAATTARRRAPLERATSQKEIRRPPYIS